MIMAADNSHLLDDSSSITKDSCDHVIVNLDSTNSSLDEIIEYNNKVKGDFFQKTRKLLQMLPCLQKSEPKNIKNNKRVARVSETLEDLVIESDMYADDDVDNGDSDVGNNGDNNNSGDYNIDNNNSSDYNGDNNNSGDYNGDLDEDDDDLIIEFNVSGCPFKTLAGTLNLFPDSVFGSKKKRDKLMRLKTGEIFFNRNPDVFRSVVTFCQTGILDAPTRVDLAIFIQDVKYFGLGPQALICGFREFEAKTVKYPKPQNHLFKTIWTVFEYPYSSVYARFISIFSLLTIIISIIVFCWETLPGYNKHGKNKLAPDKIGTVVVLHRIEMVCVFYFALELVTRLIVSPNKYQFITDFLNIIDLVSIISYFLSQFSITQDTGYIYAFRVIRLFRVSRVFKLSRHSNEMKILGVAVRESAKDMLVLISFVLIGVLLFSSAIYYAEEGNDKSNLKSIPGAFWWSIVTMTTVGYGDMVPVSIAGRIVGAACAVSGILLISMIIPIIANNFTKQYKVLKPKPTYFEEIKRIKEQETKKKEIKRKCSSIMRR